MGDKDIDFNDFIKNMELVRNKQDFEKIISLDEDEEELLVIPKILDPASVRTCAFFSPSESSDPETTAVSEHYKFDRPLKSFACSCPQVNVQGEITCQAVDYQQGCQFYQSDPVEILAGRSKDDCEIILAKTRVGYANIAYEVIKKTPEADETLHRFVLAGEPEAEKLAREEYSSELVKSAMSSAKELDLKPTKKSFLQELMSG